MAENTEFVWECDAKYFLSDFMSEISTVCKLNTTDMKFHWSTLNDVEVTASGTVVLSVSFICLYKTRIKIHEKFTDKWKLKQLRTFQQIYSPQTLPVKSFSSYFKKKLFIFQKWNYTEIIRHHISHTKKNTKTVFRATFRPLSKCQKKITRTGLILGQHGKLQPQRKRVKTVSEATPIFVISGNFSSQTRQTNLTWFLINLGLCKVAMVPKRS